MSRPYAPTSNLVPKSKPVKSPVPPAPDVDQDEQPAMQGAMSSLAQALQKKTKVPPQIQNLVGAMKKRKQKNPVAGGI